MKTTHKNETGRYGEKLAAQYLLKKGYQIVAANWRCALGEIDLIARQADTLVFVEVRTRRASSTAAAFESIIARKQKRLHRLAEAYLAQQGLYESAWRIDLIAIALPPYGSPIIEHIEHGLEW